MQLALIMAGAVVLPLIATRVTVRPNKAISLRVQQPIERLLDARANNPIQMPLNPFLVDLHDIRH